MASSRDSSQYGNEKGLSIEHYLIKMIHKILCAVDHNSQKDAYAVILSMIDWSHTFDRQSHYLGIMYLIQNGVRPSNSHSYGFFSQSKNGCEVERS